MKKASLVFTAFAFTFFGPGCRSADESAPSRSSTLRLDELPIECVSCGYGEPKWGKSNGGNVLRIQGVEYECGLGTHAPSEMRIRLFGDAETFTAEVGVDDEMSDSSPSSIEFIVQGDGRILWRSGIMRADDSAMKVEVDLAGVDVLTLAVTDGGNGIASDHGDWADAEIVFRGREPAGITLEETAIEKIRLLAALQRGKSAIGKDDALRAVKFVENAYDRIADGDTRLRQILDTLYGTGELPREFYPEEKIVTISGRKRIYLDDLGTAGMTCGWNSPNAGKSVDGNPIRIAGRRFSRGIGTHAASKILIDLSGKAESFTAWVGVDDEMSPGAGSVEFVVTGDGEVLWRSGVMTSGDTAREINVGLKGTERLLLEVTDGGDGIGSDHGDWADAVLTVIDRTPRVIPPGLTQEEKFTQIPWRRPIDRLAVTWGSWLGANLRPAEVTKHPAADYFPGKVSPDAPRIARDVNVDLAVPFWQGTGLYAPPGEQITVRIPRKYTGVKFRAQIGCHTDRLWHLDKLLRAPAVTRWFDLDSEETVIASAFGGPVYIAVPAVHENGKPYYGAVRERAWTATTQFDKPARAAIRISGAVEGIRFVNGRTSVKEWRKKISDPSVPVAEIEGRNMVWSFRASIAREIDNPGEVADFWDDVMKHMAVLAGRPGKRPAPERFVLDRQISAGGGHSGYPIMAYESWQGVLDIATLREKGTWGAFHEIGHNLQMPGWAFFHGQGETSVNFFSLYGNARMCGWNLHARDEIPGDTRGWERMMSKESHIKALREYFSRDPDKPGKWMEAGAGGKLFLHFQLIDGFGWEPLEEVIASFLKEDSFPESEVERAGEFVVRYSHAAQRNLYPFFFQWGFEMPEETEERCAHLPVWMPELIGEI